MRKLINLLLFVTLFVTLHAPLSKAEVGYLHGEHLQSTHVVSNSEGRVQEALQYTPFGERIPFAQVQRVAYQFTGQEADFESDLYDYGFRGYDPSLSRFLSVDPVLAEPPYAYVRNNPVRWSDPEGRQAEDPNPSLDDAARFEEGVLLREQSLKFLEGNKETLLGGTRHRDSYVRARNLERLEENRGERLATLKDLLRIYKIQEEKRRPVERKIKNIERRIKAVQAERDPDWEEAFPKAPSEIPYSSSWGLAAFVVSVVAVIILGEGFFNPVACDPDEPCGSSSARPDSLDGGCDSNIQSCLPSWESPLMETSFDPTLDRGSTFIGEVQELDADAGL